MSDPLAAWLTPGAASAPESVASALARAMLPPEADAAPPHWLRRDQRLSFRRTVAAAERYGGALLADGVGTGKTFIALAAVTAMEPRSPIHVIAPASLLTQWRRAAALTGVTVLPHSHETLSRGRPPGRIGGPVVIDESHRLRTPSTRRYSTLAPWCVGRRGILVSATPSVNRLTDVAHQLLLLVRDDALAWSGVASLLAALASHAPGALAHLVVTGEDRSVLLPERQDRELRVEEPPGSAFHELFSGIRSLALSSDRPTGALVRVVLLRALASSPLAIHDALGRYRSLLRHARDAVASGRLLSRHAIRSFAGGDGDQLVFWPLVAETSPEAELCLDDLERVDALVRVARSACSAPDAKAGALEEIVADRRPTLVFTSATATVSHLRSRLRRTGTAWCTGTGAGLDSTRMPRECVLDWFRSRVLPGDGVLARPVLLLATDVASEGLDLPLIERVVHYDLPWTSVRIDQRSGRAFRLGSAHPRVEVIRVPPPPELAAALRQELILQQKSALPARLGIDRGPSAPWRLRARVAAAWQEVEPAEGTAVTPGEVRGLVAGFRIRLDDGSHRALVAAKTAGGWTDDAATISGLLSAAAGRQRIEAGRPEALRRVVHGLSARVRAALRLSHGVHLSAGTGRAARQLRHRMIALGREAARIRDRRSLPVIERAVGFLRRGHTAGEEQRLRAWSALPDRDLLAVLAELPPEPDTPQPVEVALIGILMVEPGPPRR